MSDSSNPSIRQQNDGGDLMSDPIMDGPATDDLEGTDRDVVDGDVNDHQDQLEDDEEQTASGSDQPSGNTRL
jgi:hypothetical protein